MTNYIDIFREKLNKYKISQKKLAEAANRSQTNISEILNNKVSPSIDSFGMLLDTCEGLHPGFKVEYHRALLGERIDLSEFVGSLSSAELSTLLVCVSQRINQYPQLAMAR